MTPRAPRTPMRSLDERIGGVIAARGGEVPFAEFMELALYLQPGDAGEGGYYTGGAVRFGPSGDFFTPPEMFSPHFGQGLARILHEQWDELGRPAPFDIVEVGGGNGVLARDIAMSLREHYPALAAVARRTLADISRPLLRQQRDATREFGAACVQASATALPLRRITGCILAYELADALPFHRLVREDGRMREVYVGVENGEYYEVARELSDAAVLAPLIAELPPIDEGRTVCVSPAARRWIAGAARALHRGRVITMDYGYATRDAIAGVGSPARYFGQRGRVGMLDITYDVDFAGLMAAGDAAGLRTVALENEVDFTAGFAPFPLGERGDGRRARYVLVQEKRPEGT